MISNQEPPDKKTIIMLSWEYPPHIIGGLARHVHELSIELVKRGYEIHVLSSRPFESLSYEMCDGVHIHRVAPLNEEDPDFLRWIGGLNLAMVNKAFDIAGNTPIHIVHTHDWMTGPAAEFISKTIGIPLVATIHGTEHGRNKGVFTELQQFIHAKEKELSRSADQVIVCSDFMLDEVSSLFGIPKMDIAVIPNGTSGDKGDLQGMNMEEIFPFTKGRKVAFSIGRIVKEKGFDTLIKAAAILSGTNPEVCFVIAGNGPLLNTYRHTVRQLNLDDAVYFIGFIPEEVRKGLLQSCEFAVFPSVYEPFGLAAAEAIACGVPSIVAETGGLKGLVENFKSGFYMEPGNEKSLAKIIKFILEHEQLAKEVAVIGKMKMEAEFSWKRNAIKTDGIYKKILAAYIP